jgi:hypothetical protein
LDLTFVIVDVISLLWWNAGLFSVGAPFSPPPPPRFSY